MAGHFVLWRIQDAVKNAYLGLAAGVTWSGVAHAAGVPNGAGGVFPGWNAASRDSLNLVRSGAATAATVGNRNNIPPHRYLGFPGGAPVPALAAQLLADKNDWINELVRPSSAGFGMVALCPAAQAAWSAGQANYRYAALMAQIAHGATSIEVYYVGGKEVT